ncbi:hypothetical protein L7F22_003826 [Adiantum nelumboides]|nr:hypothetical protein [Adiantum nelumboides]
MESLLLHNNHLRGIIPESVVTNRSLLLQQSYNDLEGELKTLFSFLRRPLNLMVLGLAHNRISGSIPPFLGKFTPALIVIDLSYNNLTGNIPHNLYLPSFQQVKIATPDLDKALATKIPPLVIKGAARSLEYVMINFRFLALSENDLEGAIPSELGDLAAMLQLNLSHNRLSGPIPAALGNLSTLEVLDLSFNKLQGAIPPSLAGLTKLAVFNVSYNEALVGSIPRGSQLANNESYIGDLLLCSYDGVLQRACQEVDAASPNGSNNDLPVGTWMDEWVSVPGLCLGIVVGFFGILYGSFMVLGFPATALWCAHELQSHGTKWQYHLGTKASQSKLPSDPAGSAFA